MSAYTQNPPPLERLAWWKPPPKLIAQPQSNANLAAKIEPPKITIKSKWNELKMTKNHDLTHLDSMKIPFKKITLVSWACITDKTMETLKKRKFNSLYLEWFEWLSHEKLTGVVSKGFQENSINDEGRKECNGSYFDDLGHFTRTIQWREIERWMHNPQILGSRFHRRHSLTFFKHPRL